MDRLWVKDVEAGRRAEGVFLVARKQQATGKNGKVFLKLLLQDKTGQLDARVWNTTDEVLGAFEAGDRVEVGGQVGSFQGRPQLTVEKIEKSLAELDPADFAFEAPAVEAPAAERDGAFQALRGELHRVSDPHVRALLLSFVDDPGIASKLRRAPAAKEIHHAYPGGLLEHILSCVRLAGRLADQYPMADRDLLIAGAFLHDIGKVSELSYDKGATGYTDEGRLIGHLVMTATWIAERARAITGFPKELELHLVHMVLAHHGRLEYGSPKLPMTLEAFLVHALDEIDSRVNAMLGQMARSPGQRWAEPQKAHERLVWKAPAPTEGGRKRGAPAKGLGKRKGGPEAPQEKPKEKQKREPAPEGGEGPRRAAGGAQAERPRRERPPREREAREREPREPAAAEPVAAEGERPLREGEERRGPKILKRAEGAPKAAGGEKLTFKPFSAFTGGEEPTPSEGPTPAEERPAEEGSGELPQAE
ncbi:3'-5' exoribonuclease YhaM family protein [Vulgatibacter incomptus]|uniref:3'->5' exoribonuclease Bsu YhaM n=1 Tax=Vulgatibacter incomptus TaxID=1391653 RepID=A0A0K1PA88_9BACT|nr:HD domain-containing protein [Vulgatibacter incomptus]AKU90453.1 3'->5' exoribonuclease Bsu YhaM [Vulgatibacter incomptus]